MKNQKSNSTVPQPAKSQASSKLILGIDPGSRVTGFGLISVEGTRFRYLKHGVIKLNEKWTFSARLLELGLAMEELLALYEPDFMSVEKIFLGKNADSAFKLGHARGVILYEALKKNIQIHEYATRSVKQTVTGTGAAEKEHVRLALKKWLGVELSGPLDASDAMALAVHHALVQSRPTAVLKENLTR